MREIDKLRHENETLRSICADLQWMAKRYANGRMTYAVGLMNEHTMTLLKMGVPLNPCGEQNIFARDGHEDTIPSFKLSDEFLVAERDYVEARKKEYGQF
jgi:hypothetical protein